VKRVKIKARINSFLFEGVDEEGNYEVVDPLFKAQTIRPEKFILRAYGEGVTVKFVMDLGGRHHIEITVDEKLLPEKFRKIIRVIREELGLS